MSFGSGSLSSSRRWSTAVDVSVIAAFRGRKRDFFGAAGSVDVVDEGEGGCDEETAFDTCASLSDIATDPVLNECVDSDIVCGLVQGFCTGDRSCGDPPAIELSGTTAPRGGGAPGSNVCGRYAPALSVINSLFERDPPGRDVANERYNR